MEALGQARAVGMEANCGEGVGDAVVGGLGGGGDGQRTAWWGMSKAVAVAERLAPCTHVLPHRSNAAVEGSIMVGSKPGCGSVDREEAVAAKAVSKGSDRPHVKVHAGLPTKGPEVGTEHVVPEASKVMGSALQY